MKAKRNISLSFKADKNPNRYRYSGNLELWMSPQPLTSTQSTVVAVFLDEPVEKVEMDWDGLNYSLESLSPTTWVGQLQLTANQIKSKTPIVVKLAHEKKRFYKAFYLRTAPFGIANNALLEKMPNLSVPPSESATVQIPYQTPNENTIRGNLLDDRFFGVTSNLSVHGTKTVSVRKGFLNGTKTGFSTATQRDETMLVNIQGRIGTLEVSGTLQDSTVDLDNTNKNNLHLKNDLGELYFGEYFADTTEGELTAFHQRLDGIKGVIRPGSYRAAFHYSESRGKARFDKVFGQNSQGPYQLSQRPVVVLSEKVRYGGKLLVKDLDYIIDYELGQITFKRIAINTNEVFMVDYSFSDTGFKQVFSLIEAGYAPTQNTNRFVWTYLNLSDKAAGVVSGNLVPDTHQMLGVVGHYEVNSKLQIHSELAGSVKNAGKGMGLKEGIHYTDERFKLVASGKRMSSGFSAIGNNALKPSLAGYQLDTEWQPMDWNNHHVILEQESYPNMGGEVGASMLDYASKWGTIQYGHYQRTDRDTSTTSNAFEQSTVQNRVSALVNSGHIQWEPGVRTTQVTNTFQPGQGYLGKSYFLNTSLQKINNVQLSTTAELEERLPVSGNAFRRNTYGLTAGISPITGYEFQGNAQLVEDSSTGKSALAGLEYTMDPIKKLNLQGNYNLETVNEPFTSPLRVMKHLGNFRFTFKPVKPLKLRYKLRQDFAEIKPLNDVRYDDQLTHQYNADWQVFKPLFLQFDFRHNTRHTLDRTKIPVIVPAQSRKGDTTLLQLFYSLSSQTDVRYFYEKELNHTTDFRNITATENTQDKSIRHSMEYTRQLTPKVRLGVNGRVETTGLFNQINVSSNRSTRTWTAETLTEWQVTPKLTTRFTTAGSKQVDLFLVNPDTYFVTPRVDVTYRPWKHVALNGFLEATKSFSGQPVRKDRASLACRYDVSLLDFSDTTFSIQGDYENDHVVRVSSWDVLLKMTATF